MKRNLLYLLPFLIMLGMACSKKADTVIVQAPVGTFTGQFRFYTKNSTGGYDSVKNSILLKMTADYHFKVTADTALYHAGSHGTFAFDGTYILFNDSTYTPSKPRTKNHLAGVFQYIYDGTNFKMIRATSGTTPDTIGRYDLVKN
ncbi:MAG TPA: hypothetical protein VIM77_06445 [Mucilaginibacter sp.]